MSGSISHRRVARQAQLKSIVATVLIASLMVVGIPAFAGSVSSGGPWTYTTGPVSCKFTGLHSALSGIAYAQTQDYNGSCAELGARLKYKKTNGVTVSGSWAYSTPSSPGTYTIYAPSTSTAVSSEHKAQNGWYPSWSSAQRPHSW